jgi:hypothetical protein
MKNNKDFASNPKNETQSLADLQRIPGVGIKLSKGLYDLGYKSVDSLKGQNPEEMYLSLCNLYGEHIDRCVLYVFRCAVYFAENSVYEPELLKWWNWKD